MTKNLRRIEPTESQIQCAIVEWANNTKVPDSAGLSFFSFNKIGDYLVKNANEGKRSFATGKRMKEEGLMSGFPDMTLYLPKMYRRPDCGCFGALTWCLLIEVKSKNGKLSKNQIKIKDRIHPGYPIVVVKSVDDGIQAIKDYLGMM